MRPHPLFIFYDIRRWIPLLLIPLVRFITANGSLLELLRASARDLTMVAVLCGVSTAKWANTAYAFEYTLQVRYGIWVKRQRTLSPDSTALISAEITPLMRVCRCCKIEVSTADRRRKTDATMYLPIKHTVSMMRCEVGAEGYRARLIPVILMALSGSNAAVGVLTLVPFVRRAATVLGDTFSSPWDTLTSPSWLTGIPPLLQGFANLLLLGWGVAVMGSLLRTLGFRAHRHNGRLQIVSGVFTKRSLQMDGKCISSLLLRQTLFTRLLGVYTATIACAGYGRETGVRPVLIPAATKRDLCRALDRLLPHFPLCRMMVRPSKRALVRYVLPPLFLIVVAIGVYVWLGVIAPLPTATILVSGVWWFTVRLVGFFHAGMGIRDGAVVMRYPRGLAFYELQVPLSSVDGIVRKQGPFQRKSGTCHVFLMCFGEKQRRHRVWGLNEEAVKRLLKGSH